MERWFDTGLFMEDGKTPILACAYNEIQAKKFIENGWTSTETNAPDKKVKGKRNERKEKGS